MIYGYLRVSTDTQDYENQKTGVIALANRLGVTIDKFIVDDGVSGAKDPKKRALGPAMKKMKCGDMVLCSELSRLGRELYMIMRILEYFANKGIKLYTDKDNFHLEDDIQSKVLAFAFGLSAEIERRLISQRTKEALALRKAQGIHVGRRYGSKNSIYKLTGKEKLVKEMLDKGVSKAAIARKLHIDRTTLWRFLKQTDIKQVTSHDQS